MQTQGHALQARCYPQDLNVAELRRARAMLPSDICVVRIATGWLLRTPPFAQRPAGKEPAAVLACLL